jgi:pyrimidine-nucleoside phosphorylase
LDKLEYIEGYNVNLSKEKFASIIENCGFAMTGQTKDIVPADRLLYALRDVTGTVESIPLITGSILSKKIAEGSDCLVFDVKYGSGAFMKTAEDAERLAESLVKTTEQMGRKASALITNMNTPLGLKTGNFLEIEETLDCLENSGPSDVMELTYALATQMILMAGKANSKDEALSMCKNAVESGKAMELFLKNVELQGGNVKTLLAKRNNRRSKFVKELKATQDGFIKIDAYQCGLAGIHLGVGRNVTTEKVCADAGFILHKTEGDFVKQGETIMQVFGKNEECFGSAIPLLNSSITYSNEKIKINPIILKEI